MIYHNIIIYYNKSNNNILSGFYIEIIRKMLQILPLVLVMVEYI